MKFSGLPKVMQRTQKRWNLNPSLTPKPMLFITNLQPSLKWIPTVAIGLDLGFWYYQGQVVALTIIKKNCQMLILVSILLGENSIFFPVSSVQTHLIAMIHSLRVSDN